MVRSTTGQPINKNQQNIFLNWIFIALLTVLTFVLYHNSLDNLFSYRDQLVGFENPITIKGLGGIPEIFTTPFDNDNGKFASYRPLGRTTFAFEYQFTAASQRLPYVNHLVNLLLYLFSGLLFFRLLKRIFQNGNPWFPFLATVLFLAHPIHTEVVDNLKNRDFILGFIFSLLSATQFFKWIDSDRKKYIFSGVLLYFLALLSNESSAIFSVLIPLLLYFFSKAKPQQIRNAFVLTAASALIILVVPTFFFASGRELFHYENHLVSEPGFLVYLSTIFYSLGWYVKMLFIPYPLSFYYGFGVIPVTQFDNILVWIGILLFLAMAVIAVFYFKRRSVISFIIFFFLISVIAFLNVFQLIPGVVGERFLFVAVAPFSMFVGWLIFKIFNLKIESQDYQTGKMIFASVIFIVLLIPAGMLTHERNKAWMTDISLYRTDVATYPTSAYINNILGRERLKPVKIEMAKKVSPYKFILPDIKEVETFSASAVSADSSIWEAWDRLGYVSAEIHGMMAVRRMESYRNQNKEVQAKQEKENAANYIKKANEYYDQAILAGHPDQAFIYSRKADAYKIITEYEEALINYDKAMKLDPKNLQYENSYIQMLMGMGRFNEAISQNELLSQRHPESDIPLLNLGGYYYYLGDTVTAVQYYEKAIELGTTRPEVGKLLYYYYKGKGNAEKANYFMMKSYEVEKTIPKEE